MREVDHKDVMKHISAINKIKPCCTAKLVQCPLDRLITIRYIISWRGKRIRASIVLGGVIDGDAKVSDIGSMCVDQWMRAYPKQKIVCVEFKRTATGNIERIRNRFINALDSMEDHGDNALLLLLAKNSTMLDKISAMIDTSKATPASQTIA